MMREAWLVTRLSFLKSFPLLERDAIPVRLPLHVPPAGVAFPQRPLVSRQPEACAVSLKQAIRTAAIGAEAGGAGATGPAEIE
jgi:hypothetical protein